MPRHLSEDFFYYYCFLFFQVGVTFCCLCVSCFISIVSCPCVFPCFTSCFCFPRVPRLSWSLLDNFLLILWRFRFSGVFSLALLKCFLPCLDWFLLAPVLVLGGRVKHLKWIRLGWWVFRNIVSCWGSAASAAPVGETCYFAFWKRLVGDLAAWRSLF